MLTNSCRPKVDFTHQDQPKNLTYLQEKAAVCPSLHPLSMAACKEQERWWCTLCGEQKEGERWTCDQRWSKSHQGEGGSCEYDICDPCMSRYTPVCERIQRLCLQIDVLQQQISSESQQQVLNLIRRQVEAGGSDLNSVELQLNLSETILNMLPGVNFDISENPLSSLDTPESLLLYHHRQTACVFLLNSNILHGFKNPIHD